MTTPSVLGGGRRCSSPGIPQVAIVGRLPIESSGDDEMLATAHDDHWTAEKLLAEVGLKAEVVTRARSLALIRIAEYVAPDDRRIERARDRERRVAQHLGFDASGRETPEQARVGVDLRGGRIGRARLAKSRRRHEQANRLLRRPAAGDKL